MLARHTSLFVALAATVACGPKSGTTEAPVSTAGILSEEPTDDGRVKQLVDMDGDGDLDLLNAGRGSNNVTWYENPTK